MSMEKKPPFSDGRRGYRMFGVHNKIHDPAYKDRFQVVKTETASHQIIYKLKIKGKDPLAYVFRMMMTKYWKSHTKFV